MGSPNYNDEDIKVLLDIVERCEPIGGNDWAYVSKQFNDYAPEIERPVRDIDSLRTKFDNLAKTKKPTGDPSCPPNVRRAKHIARDILGKVNAISVGDEDCIADISPPDTLNRVYSDSESQSTPAKRKRICKEGTFGVRKGKRVPGAAGIRKENGDDLLIEHVGDMSQAICSLIKREEEVGKDSISKEEVKRIVKEEVRAELATTNASISELKELLMMELNKSA